MKDRIGQVWELDGLMLFLVVGRDEHRLLHLLHLEGGRMTFLDERELDDVEADIPVRGKWERRA